MEWKPLPLLEQQRHKGEQEITPCNGPDRLVVFQARLQSPPLSSHLKILHQQVRYEKRGPAVSANSQPRRLAKMARELNRAGYQVITPVPPTAETA